MFFWPAKRAERHIAWMEGQRCNQSVILESNHLFAWLMDVLNRLERDQQRWLMIVHRHRLVLEADRDDRADQRCNHRNSTQITEQSSSTSSNSLVPGRERDTRFWHQSIIGRWWCNNIEERIGILSRASLTSTRERIEVRTRRWQTCEFQRCRVNLKHHADGLPSLIITSERCQEKSIFKRFNSARPMTNIRPVHWIIMDLSSMVGKVLALVPIHKNWFFNSKVTRVWNVFNYSHINRSSVHHFFLPLPLSLTSSRWSSSLEDRVPHRWWTNRLQTKTRKCSFHPARVRSPRCERKGALHWWLSAGISNCPVMKDRISKHENWNRFMSMPMDCFSNWLSIKTIPIVPTHTIKWDTRYPDNSSHLCLFPRSVLWQSISSVTTSTR